MRSFYFLLFFLIAYNLQGQIITTVAGSGTGGYSGDGGPALNAQLGEMYYTYPAFDNAGNMYIAQNLNNTIRKIDAAGIITTIAGTNGVIGYTGDGGPAANALLYHPTSIAVDNANNIYFADRNGEIIRKIAPSGIITTVSGQYTTVCGVGDGGVLALAQFVAISALTIDPFNNLYIADYGCNTIRKVDASGIITTIGGNGTLGFSGDGGPATQAQLAYPCKVGVDIAGNVYIPDAQNHRIRKINTAGIITTVAGMGMQGYSGDGGPAINAKLAFPGSVVVDNFGNLYFGDNDRVIRKVDASGTITTYAGNGSYGYSGDGGPATSATIVLTEGRISIYNNDIFFVNYPAGHVIRKVSNCASAAITQQPMNYNLCNTGNASFSVSAINAVSYQWQLNTGSGWNDLTDNATYSGSSTAALTVTGATVLMNNYQYRCAVVNGCGPVFSIAALLLVAAPSTPTIAVATSATNICQGTAATFTAAVTNGGTTPIYQWKKNNINVGTNSNTYTDNGLLNGDIISCNLVSNASCLAINTAAGNLITMTVNAAVTPTISMQASANNICFGTPVTFTTSVTNGGSSAGYAWFKNNVNLFFNAPTYTDNALNNGDVIQCVMSSGIGCVTAASVSSLPVIINVNPMISSLISINCSANGICKHTTVVFNAVVTNGGTTQLYQWKKNGFPVGTNSSGYSDNNLLNGDIITCTLLAGGVCIIASPVNSNALTMVVHDSPVASLDKTAVICEGAARILDPGAFAGYVWNTGSVNRTITVNGIGQYWVTVTDKNGCKGNDTAKITTVFPSPVQFLPADTFICSYDNLLLRSKQNFTDYLWNNGSNEQSILINRSGQYWLQVKNNDGCIGKDSINVLPKDCMKGFFMPNAFTPDNDGKNDLLRPRLFGSVKKYKFWIYNRMGQQVFYSTDTEKGWNGYFKGLKQNQEVFVWICNYQFEGEEMQIRKGAVILLR